MIRRLQIEPQSYLKHFIHSAAFYYTMLLGFLLFEAFTEDVGEPVVPAKDFPTTLRRQLVDVAAKMVTHADKAVLKVTVVAMESFRSNGLRKRYLSVPRFAWSCTIPLSRIHLTGEGRPLNGKLP